MCEGVLYIVSLSSLYFYVVCGFLVLNSQPVHNVLLHLDGWHTNSLLSALFQQSHERYSPELTHSKMYPERTKQIWIACWGLIDQNHLLYREK